MNWSDFTIIYLALGAPFGVYYFLRQPRKSFAVCFKSILIAAAWIVFAFIWRRETGAISAAYNSAADETGIAAIQQNLNEFAARNSSVAALFEWRETLERFVGLSFAVGEMNGDDAPNAKETELARFSPAADKNFNARCLHRRNRKLLSFHHTLARRDFLQTLAALAANVSESHVFLNSSLELAAALNDETAETAIKKLMLQIAPAAAVNSQEKVLWNTEPTAPIFLPNSNLTLPRPSSAPVMTTNLSVKD